jgi:tartrate-resistant acid phosphatase type 5
MHSGTAFLLASFVSLSLSLKLIAVGDWGGASAPPYVTGAQVFTAAAMGVVGAALNISEVWGVGDNFYEDGVSCAGDPDPTCKPDATWHRFVDTFEHVYTAPSLQVPWYLISGNHDWHAVANTSAELAYATRADRATSRWTYPDFYYSKQDTFADAAGTTVTVKQIFIDTVILCGLSAPGQGGQPAPPTARAGANPIPDSETHWKWLAAQLAGSTKATWVVVVGHYPVWSVAEHGTTTCLSTRLLPMLTDAKVALYVNGHDHNLQMLDDGSGVGFIDCGAGHESDDSQAHNATVPPGALKFFAAPVTGGFVSLDFEDASSVQVGFWDGQANSLLNVTWANPKEKM